MADTGNNPGYPSVIPAAPPVDDGGEVVLVNDPHFSEVKRSYLSRIKAAAAQSVLSGLSNN